MPWRYGEVQRVGSLEAKHVDVAVIAATNRDLRAEAANGRFRSDLYYRLSVMEIHLVPLRERREDIPYLSAVFLREARIDSNRPMIGMSPAAERTLLQAPWPGNVRELRNVIERACLLSDGKMLSERDVLAAMPAGDRHAGARGGRPSQPCARPRSTWDPDFLTQRAARAGGTGALREAGGNKAAAARLLGISRRSMFRWLERLRSLAAQRSHQRIATDRRERVRHDRGVPCAAHRSVPSAARNRATCHGSRSSMRPVGCVSDRQISCKPLRMCDLRPLRTHASRTGRLAGCRLALVLHVTTTGSREPKENRVRKTFVRSSMIVALTVTTAGLASPHKKSSPCRGKPRHHNAHGDRERTGRSRFRRR